MFVFIYKFKKFIQNTYFEKKKLNCCSFSGNKFRLKLKCLLDTRTVITSSALRKKKRSTMTSQGMSRLMAPRRRSTSRANSHHISPTELGAYSLNIYSKICLEIKSGQISLYKNDLVVPAEVYKISNFLIVLPQYSH